MIVAFGALGTLLVLIPALIAAGNVLVCGIASAVAAVGIIAIAVAQPPTEIDRLLELVRPVALLGLLIPCIWILLQILPLAGGTLANSAWATASAALGRQINGSVTIDTGASVLALARYLTAAAIVLLSVAVAINRQRAGTLLTIATAIAVAASLELIVVEMDLVPVAHLTSHSDVANLAAIGLIVSCASVIRAYENLQARKGKPRESRPALPLAMAASLAAAAICLFAILASSDSIAFAAFFGAGIVTSACVIHRLRLALWGQIGLASIAAVAILGLLATAPAKDIDLTLSLAKPSQFASIERMLSDVKWTGAGAGTFDALVPIYRDIDEANLHDNASTAAIVAIEMGRPFLWGSVVFLLFVAALLFRRALARGRDYVYASAGAGCIVALVISSFTTNGALGPTTSLMASVICGLAIAQSLGAAKRRSEWSVEDNTRSQDGQRE